VKKSHFLDKKDIQRKEALGLGTDRNYETKNVPFKLVGDTKELTRNGEDIFVFEGYASTRSVDRGGDIIAQGAFDKTIARNKDQGNRPVRMKYQHSIMDTIGGFPIQYVREDEKGLKVRGEVCLGVQRGKEVKSLIKSGFLSDLSIGFNVVDFEMDKSNNRVIKDLELWEISVVDEPMNPEAEISNFKSYKSVVPYQDLPIAPEDTEWDADEADRRVREFTNSTEEPSDSYKRAFFWYDSAAPENFGSYKLGYADVIDGQLMAVPRAIFAVHGVLDGARGGVDIPQADQESIKRQVARYYEKMGLEAPVFKSIAVKFKVKDVKEALKTPRLAENMLKSTGAFTEKCCKYLGKRLFESEKAAMELEGQFEEGKEMYEDENMALEKEDGMEIEDAKQDELMEDMVEEDVAEDNSDMEEREPGREIDEEEAEAVEEVQELDENLSEADLDSMIEVVATINDLLEREDITEEDKDALLRVAMVISEMMEDM